MRFTAIVKPDCLIRAFAFYSACHLTLLVPKVPPEAGLLHQASKDLPRRVETTPADSDLTTVTEEW